MTREDERNYRVHRFIIEGKSAGFTEEQVDFLAEYFEIKDANSYS